MRLLRKYWLEAAWAVFATVNVVAIFALSEYETIPFHFVWVSLAFLYCVRPWPVRVTATVLAAVMLATAVALSAVVLEHGAGYDELSEVPLMAAMYIVIVWHARRTQQAMEERRRAAERERDFVRDASHTLRTPVTVALGHAELARGASDVGETASDVDIVIDELRRIATISDRMILLASAGHPHFLEQETVDVGSLLRTVAKRWTGAALRDVNVTVQPEGTIVGDEERLALALDCLVENAVKATSDGDRISIAGRAENGTASLEVSDGGTGIAQEDQVRIFERFARAPRPEGRTNGNGSTGLGLAIVKAIAEAHGGTVELESEHGRGSTFRIRLNGFCMSVPEGPPDLRSPSSEVVELEDFLAPGSHAVAS